MKWMKTVILLVLFILVIFFSMQNREEVVLRFGLRPFWPLEREAPGIPLFLVILCSVFLGVLVGGLSDFYSRFQLKKMVRQQQRTIEKLERELSFRQPPVLEPPSNEKPAV